MKSIQVAIENLKFDLQNPRFDSSSGQRDILQKIINNQEYKLAILAHDIINQGLNPIDRMILIQADGSKDFVVLEGNRRLAALQLLSNPVLLNSVSMKPTMKNKFQEYSKQYDKKVIEPIDTALFDNREEANHWIELRHTGENNGAGIVDWDGIMTARFRGNTLSLQAIEFVRKHGKIDEKKLQKFNVTNLDRLLGDIYVRDVLGLDAKNKKLISHYSPSEIIKGLQFIISEIAAERLKVNLIHNKTDRKNFIDNLPRTVKPDKEKTINSWALDSVEKFKVSKTIRTHGSIETVRKTLIPKDFKIQISDKRIKDIFIELQRNIKIDECPNAVAVLFRVFFELSTDFYITEKKITGVTEHSSLPKKIQAVENDLAKNGIDPNVLKPIRVMTSDKDSFLSCDTFHAYVHSRKMTPIPSELRTAWDRAQNYFELILL